MDPRTLRVLEYHRIVELLAEHATSTVGKEQTRALEPAADLDVARARQQETSEARFVLEEDSAPPLGGIRDIREVVRGAAKHQVLEPAHLLDIAGTAFAARRLRSFVLSRQDACPALAAHALGLRDFRHLEDEITHCVDSRAQVKDDASEELTRLRQRAHALHASLEQRLQRVLHNRQYERMIQEPLITVRNGRYCIPIRSEFRTEFRGIIHGSSASGATVFMEPLALVDTGNDLAEAREEEEREVRRILAGLSQGVGRAARELLETVEVLATLDAIFARAHLSQAQDACAPQLNADGVIDVVGARHPLLAGDVVPIDIRIGEGFTALVITGPNTGGKTVSLKTVGLLSLMAQSGLHVPAEPGSRLAAFKQIFADIGDEQSIQQNLSTFSSHMAQIVEVMRAVPRNANALVLLDEIGAGTDPAEGSALAKAILTEMHSRGARTVVTTHYGELKAFAYAQPGIENASVEFDPQSLQPTYHLRIGLPGSSTAFAIARRLGLPDDVVSTARSMLGETQTVMEDAIRGIEESQRRLQAERAGAERERRELQAARADFERRLRDLESKRSQILRDARREASRVLNETRAQAAEIIERLQHEARRKPKRAEADRTAHQAQGDLARVDERVEEALPAPPPEPAPPPPKPEPEPAQPVEKIRPGEAVIVRTVGQRGTILGPAPEEGMVEVQVGILKLKVRTEDLEQVPPSEMEPAPQLAKAGEVPPEIHLRGMRVADALEVLDKYLDDAILAGMTEVRIVHGLGTGAVRNAVREALAKHPHVHGYRQGRRDEGAAGVTIAELVPGDPG
ncbi:MAG: endonuclease MutS2 [Armatimonadota bacterium]|nr:MAG: endonuclease MutS2 [Armatimonadota bacterium]